MPRSNLCLATPTARRGLRARGKSPKGSLMTNQDQQASIDSKNAQSTAASAEVRRTVDPFDPDSLRLDQSFAAVTAVRKLINQVPVRKPDRQTFVRVHPDPGWRLETGVIEIKEDREVYLVSPALRQDVAVEIVPVTLFSTISRQGVFSLWPIRLPGPDGKINPWPASALKAAEVAMRRWIKLQANMQLGAYEVFEAVGDLDEPIWPEIAFAEALRIAFQDRFIADMDHPVLRRLRGAI